MDADGTPITAPTLRPIDIEMALPALRPRRKAKVRVRQFAADLGINLNTVARAYRELTDARLLASVRGRLRRRENRGAVA
jgi:DNA-binding transcriptional regulator YhcF (GntR family)